MSEAAIKVRQAPAAAVETVSLEKRFGRAVALDGVDLRVQEGDFCALFGPNGAGKTTLIRVLAAFTRPSGGKVFVGGLDLHEAGEEVRRRLGVVTHQTLLYRDLTVEENLRLYARLYDLTDVPGRVADALARMALSGRAHEPVRTLSRGLQQRVAIARAILHDPAILLLDEPYSGLDAQAATQLTDLLSELAGRGRAVLMATHDPERSLELCSRVAILNEGRLAYETAAEGLTASAFRRLYADVVEGRQA